MSALNFSVDAAGISLTGGSPKTMIQAIAPTNQVVTVKGFQLSFDGATSTATPATVQLLRQTTAGTVTSATPRKLDSGRAETIQSTAGINATSEPTSGEVIFTEFIPVYGGNKTVFFPSNLLPIIPGGTRLGLRVTSPANVNCSATMLLEE
jgi:hypothetical protein